MTTGNDPYVQHLRGQLSAVLDDVTPSAAPTAAVKRRGKAIRTRRRVGVAAGLVVAVVVAALVPGLLRQPKAPSPVTRKHPKVTVRPVGRDAAHGLIAQGAIDGKPWRITLRRQGKYLCVISSGKRPETDCTSPDSYAASWPATLGGVGGGSIEALYGTVTGQVNRVSLALSDGVVLNLRPVRSSGYKWIAVELPASLPVTKVTAYSRRGELAYAIPFTAGLGGLPSVSNWLRPSEPAPREFVRAIGSGIAIHSGPWGQCAVSSNPADRGTLSCWPTTRLEGAVSGGSGDRAKGTQWIIAATRRQVSYVVLAMTDGSTRRVRVVKVGTARLYAVVIVHGPRIASWAAYDASGHQLYGGQGSPG
jgi:hypothetical protein